MTGPDQRGPNRQHVRLDRFALFDIRRENGLSVGAFAILTAIALRADFHTGALVTSYDELSSDVGMNRKSVPKALQELRGAGVIEERVSFGPNRRGEIVLLRYEDLIVSKRGSATKTDWSQRRQTAREEAATAHDIPNRPTIGAFKREQRASGQ